MKTGVNGIELIKSFEGFRSKPYLDAVKVPTIGYGATHYGNGIKVKMTDKPISEYEATQLLKFMVVEYENYVKKLLKREIVEFLPSSEPLSPIAPAIIFFEREEAIWALTENEPADSPAMVIFFGSPPKALMFC